LVTIKCQALAAAGMRLILRASRGVHHRFSKIFTGGVQHLFPANRKKAGHANLKRAGHRNACSVQFLGNRRPSRGADRAALQRKRDLGKESVLRVYPPAASAPKIFDFGSPESGEVLVASNIQPRFRMPESEGAHSTCY